MSILRHFRLTLFTFIAVPSVLLAASDTTQFKVTSYIPVLFRDIRWTIGGQFDASGSSDRDFGPPSSADLREDKFGNRSRSFSAQSDWMRRRTTRNSDFLMRLGGETGYDGARTSSTYKANLPDENSDQLDSTNLDTYFFRLLPNLQYSRYLTGDFFGAFEGQGNIRITKDFNDDATSHYKSTDSSWSSNVYVTDGISSWERNRSTEQYSYSLFLSAGWGRVYFGNYAATALYMIKELNDHGQLKSLPGYAVLDSLTEMIYQYRMKHVVDSRITRLEALSAITSYLRSNGIVDGTDPILELYLQDVWDYFPTTSRPFGFRARFGGGVTDSRIWYAQGFAVKSHSVTLVRPANTDGPVDTIIDSGQSASSDCSWIRETRPYLRGGMEYYRPIDLRTQFSSSLDGYYYLNSKERQNNFVADWSAEYYATFSTSLDYIFSSRTRVRAEANLAYETFVRSDHYADQPDLEPSRTRLDYFSYNLWCTVEFRIAIPTVLSGNLSYYGSRRNLPQLYNGDMPRSAQDGYTLSLSISHYLY